MESKIINDKSALTNHYESTFYKKIMPEFTTNYWRTKNYSEKMKQMAWDKDDNVLPLVIQWFEEIQDTGYWQRMIAKYCSKKSKIGVGANIIYFIKDKNGKTIPYVKTAEGIVRYSKVLGVEVYVEVIENFTTGIVPIIKMTRYGRNSDSTTYELADSSFEVSEEDKSQVDKILKTTENITHNNGFVRALVFINRVGDSQDGNSESYGRPDIFGFEDKIQQLDDMDSRLNLIIDQDSGHIEKTISGGTIDLDGGNGNDIVERKTGLYQRHTETFSTAEGVDTIYIAGLLDMSDLSRIKSEIKRELYIYLEMQVEYDSEGKTNDTNAKVDKVGDMAFKGAKRRVLEDEEYWTDLFSTIVLSALIENKRNSFLEPKLLAELEKCVKVKITPRSSDIRKLFEVMQHMDKLLKFMPISELYALFLDTSEAEGIKMLAKKEKEIKENISSGLGVMNGNPPSNLELKLDWATKKEEEGITQDQGDKNEER